MRLYTDTAEPIIRGKDDTSHDHGPKDPAWRITKAQRIANKKRQRKLEKPHRLKKQMAPPHG